MKLQTQFTIILAAIIVFAIAINAAWAGPAKSWNLDKAHTSVNFSINHFFTPVNGKFEDFSIKLNFDPQNLDGSSLDVEIQVASVNTGNEKRDGHLQTDDFFKADKFPVMTFKSSKIISKGNNEFIAKGSFMIKDIKKEIELPFSLLGLKELPEEMQKKMGRKEIAGFQAKFSINRIDYTVGTGSWAATMVVSDEVNIAIDVEVFTK